MPAQHTSSPDGVAVVWSLHSLLHRPALTRVLKYLRHTWHMQLLEQSCLEGQVAWNPDLNHLHPLYDRPTKTALHSEEGRNVIQANLDSWTSRTPLDGCASRGTVAQEPRGPAYSVDGMVGWGLQGLRQSCLTRMPVTSTILASITLEDIK